jgi:predicted amidophosphoribosyltransferase
LSNRATETFDCVTRIARLALPQHCELCVADCGDELLCKPCIADLPRLPSACPACALPISGGLVCGVCLAHPPPWSRTVAAFVYAFPVDQLLQQLKYRGRLALADWAGAALADAVRASFASRAPAERPDRIVALPLAKSRQRNRGFNQAHEIGVRAARAVGLPLTTPLTRVADTTPQAALLERARATSAARLPCGAFAARGSRSSTYADGHRCQLARSGAALRGRAKQSGTPGGSAPRRRVPDRRWTSSLEESPGRDAVSGDAL